MTPRTREEKFLHCGNVGKVLHCGSIEDYADPLLGIEHHNRFLHRGNVEKCIHRRSVERVLYCGIVEDCANLLLGIKHHNDSYAVVEWRSSYIMEVWKRTFMYNSGNRLSKGCYYMCETMPLGLAYTILDIAFQRAATVCVTMPLSRIYMYNSGNLLSKGCCCMQETMPLGGLGEDPTLLRHDALAYKDDSVTND
nr:hypothetical protein CFP56_61610 [Quercus suber]